jgi:hypothetical protein
LSTISTAHALALGKPLPRLGSDSPARTRRQYTWVDNVTTDYYLWYHSGNDLRTIGLWHYRIPTLGHVSISITPQYFLTVSEFLSQRAIRRCVGS